MQIIISYKPFSSLRVIMFHVYHLKWLRCSSLIFFFLTGDKIVFTCDKKSGILSKGGKKKKVEKAAASCFECKQNPFSLQ